MSCRAALVLPAFLAACGWSSADEQVLSSFFQHSRTRDKTLLADYATVAFEPRVDGSVERFEIERVEPEHRRPLSPTDDTAFAIQSLTPAGQPDVDLSGATVEIGEKQLAVRVQLRTPGGRDETPVLLITMRHAVARRGDHAVQGRWLVTGVKQG